MIAGREKHKSFLLFSTATLGDFNDQIVGTQPLVHGTVVNCSHLKLFNSSLMAS